MAGIIAAVIGAAGAIGGAAINSNASSSAAGASGSAARRTLDEQRRQFDLTRQDNEPWRRAGTAALGRLENPLANFQASPDYAFRRDQGMEGIAQSKAVGGLLKSGSALQDLNAFNSNLAAGEFGDWWNRQAGLAGIGQTANAANQQAGQAYANAVGNTNMWNAQNQMQSAYMGANALNQGLGGLAGSALWYLNNQPANSQGTAARSASTGGGNMAGWGGWG